MSSCSWVRRLLERIVMKKDVSRGHTSEKPVGATGKMAKVQNTYTDSGVFVSY